VGGCVIKRGIVACFLLSQFACTNGCDPNFVYPRQEADAGLTPQVLQASVSGTGLQSFADTLPSLLLTNCQNSTSCAVAGNNVVFYLGSPEAPISFSLLGTQATLRNAGPLRAKALIDTNSLRGNIHLNLTNDGLEIVVGCSQDSCPSDQYVKGSVDFTAVMNNALGDFACRARSDGNQGFTIKSFRFIVHPVVEAGPDGTPHIALHLNSRAVEKFLIDLSLKVDAANTDPACTDSAIWPLPSTYECDGFCTGANALQGLTSFIVQQDTVSTAIASAMVQALASQLDGTPLQGGGQIDLSTLMPVHLQRPKPLEFLLSAHPAPLVKNQRVQLAFDLGIHAQHSACAPLAAPQDWLTLPPLDVTQSTVPLANSDLALFIGETAVQRLFYGLYQSGNLCWLLDAENVIALSGGQFMPTVQTFSFIVPDLGELAEPDAPVDIALIPSQMPEVHFGTGVGDDSTVQMRWLGVNLELYPLVDEAYSQALGFTFDLNIALTVQATPDGDLQLHVDHLSIDNVTQSYNEVLAPFETQALQAMLSTLLPLVVSGQPIPFDLSSFANVLPLTPKFLGVEKVGPYLGILAKLCADPANCVLPATAVPTRIVSPTVHETTVASPIAEMANTQASCEQTPLDFWAVISIAVMFIVLKRRRLTLMN
jgi:hypothetical protein